MKSNSNAAQTRPSALIEPCITPALAFAVCSCASARRSKYLRESLNLSVSIGSTSAPIFEAAVRVEQRVETRPRGETLVAPALRADVRFFSRSVL